MMERFLSVAMWSGTIWEFGEPKLRMLSSKLDVLFANSKLRVYIPLFFIEQSSTGLIYLDMGAILMPQLERYNGFYLPTGWCATTPFPFRPSWFLKQETATVMNQSYGENDDHKLISWPPSSTDISPGLF